MAVSAVNALACVPRRGSDRIGSGRVRGGTGQCRFPPASFDISVETETGGAGCTPDEKGRTSMGAKTEALARQFEGKAQDAVATLEKLGDGDWKKVTAAERWTVGVTAHHLSGGLEAVAGIVTGIVSGAPSRGNFTPAMLDEMNGQQAQEHASATPAGARALLPNGPASAFAAV